MSAVSPKCSRSIFSILTAILFLPMALRAGGVVSTSTESALVSAMAGGGTVTFSFNGIIYLTNTLVVSNNTTLDGTGWNVSISGNGAVQIMDIQTNTTVVLSNLTFQDGLAEGSLNPSIYTLYPAAGGAISNAGVVQAYSCTFSNNQATGYNSSGYSGSVSFPGGPAFGGAVYNNGSFDATSCVFADNEATGGAGDDYFLPAIGIYGGQGSGGAIYNLAQATILSSTFVSNAATGGLGGNGGYLGANPGPSGAGGAASGGAIFTSDNIVVSNTTFALNAALGGLGGNGIPNYALTSVPGPAGGAGGVANGGGFCSAGGLALIACSTFWSNSTVGGLGGAGGAGSSPSFQGGTGGSGGNGGVGGLGDGGAISVGNGTNTIVNCTFWANSGNGGNAGAGGNGGNPNGRSSNGGNGGNGGQGGNGSGGAIGITGGFLTMTNITVASNFVAFGSGGVGGSGGQQYPGNPGSSGNNGAAGAVQGSALANTGGTSLLLNSILAYRTTGDTNVYGSLIDAGYNISFDGQLSLTNSTSRNGINPDLGPLAWNGGPTETMALLAGSPAIDAADPSAFPPVDQRGYPRPWGAGPDIGAFEYSVANVLLIGAHGGGTLSLGYGGTNGQTYEIQISTDLIHWTSIQTNTFGPSGYLDTTVAVTNPAQFFRAVSP